MRTDNKIEFEGGVKMTADTIPSGTELVQELNKMLQGYATELSAQQKRAILECARDDCQTINSVRFVIATARRASISIINKTNAIKDDGEQHHRIATANRQFVNLNNQKDLNKDMDLKSSATDHT